MTTVWSGTNLLISLMVILQNAEVNYMIKVDPFRFSNYFLSLSLSPPSLSPPLSRPLSSSPPLSLTLSLLLSPPPPPLSLSHSLSSLFLSIYLCVDHNVTNIIQK